MKTLNIAIGFVVVLVLGILSSYASAQYVQENLSIPKIGNRQSAVSIDYHLDENKTKFLQFRFFDNHANQTIYHVGVFVNITSSGKILLAEPFHTDSGNLILKIEPMVANETKATNIVAGNYANIMTLTQYFGVKHPWLVVNATVEPIHVGFESANGGDIITIHSDSFFNSSDASYRIQTSIYSIDNDHLQFPLAETPKLEYTIGSRYPSSTTLFYNQPQNTPSYQKLMQQVQYEPPLDQFKSGIFAPDVKCRGGLELIFKHEDGSPACVKPDTAKILIMRGWARIPPVGLPALSLQNQTITTNNADNANLSIVDSYEGEKLINLTKNLFQVHEILQRYPDVTVSVLSRSSNSSEFNGIPLDVRNMIKYSVTRILHPQEETRQLDFSVYFDYNDKIVESNVSCGGHVSTSSPNPSQEMMNLCFSMIPL